jgi:hypothetical protein
MQTEKIIPEPTKKSAVANFYFGNDKRYIEIYNTERKKVYGDTASWDASRERTVERVVKVKIPVIFHEEVSIFTEDLGKIGFADVELEVDPENLRLIFRANHTIPEIRNMFWQCVAAGYNDAKYRNRQNTQLTVTYAIEYGEYVRILKTPDHSEGYAVQSNVRNIQASLRKFIGVEKYYESETRVVIQKKDDFATEQKRKEEDEHLYVYRSANSKYTRACDEIADLYKKIEELEETRDSAFRKIEQEGDWLVANGVEVDTNGNRVKE